MPMSLAIWSTSYPCSARGEDAGPAQPVDRRMVRVFGVNVPFVFLDLDGHSFFPTTAQLETFGRVGEPASPARAETVGGVLGALRRIEIEIVAEALDRLQPSGVRERHRRLGPAVDLERVCRGERDMKSPAPLPGLLRPAP